MKTLIIPKTNFNYLNCKYGDVVAEYGVETQYKIMNVIKGMVILEEIDREGYCNVHYLSGWFYTLDKD